MRYTNIILLLFIIIHGNSYAQVDPLLMDSMEYCKTFTFNSKQYNIFDNGFIYSCGLPIYSEVYCVPEDSNQVLIKEKTNNEGSYSIGFWGLKDFELSNGNTIKCWMRMSTTFYFNKDDQLIKIEAYKNEATQPLQRAKVILKEN
ncbi:MAG: hypothetical protein MK105_02660 [Crocinitomicaceae bacterium]|nr:hypothetical protein [Crocinitomicaceae bacterium]